MPAKMMIEMPLPMPSSVMRSPSQTANMVPAAMVVMTVNVTSGFWPNSGMMGAPPRLPKMAICPTACKIDIGIAR